MTADESAAHQPAASKGGSVEPVDRAAVAKERFQIPDDNPGERYELRDPFAEVTYRADTLPQIVAKAEQLGSSLFYAVTEDGTRTPVRKVDGDWQRGPQSPLAPERPLNPVPARHQLLAAPTAVTTPGSASAPVQPAPLEQGDAETIAKIEARAERAALVARLEAALTERYIIKRTPVTVGDVIIGRNEYRFRDDTSRVAFTESTLRLATNTNSPSVARLMVDVVEARNWKALRVSGHKDFKRMVWLEASVRGVKTLGYEPNPGDVQLLRRQREARMVNRIEPTRDASGSASATTDKASGRGGGRKAVLAAIEAVLVAKRVPDTQRAAVMAAAAEKLSQRRRDGQTPKVKIYDRSAPSQRPVVVPAPEIQRSRERAVRAPVR